MSIRIKLLLGFGILIAIEFFGAGSFAKGSVSAAFMIGLLLAPVSIFPH